MLDDRMRAAIARLTENEKECLRRRLLPQTATGIRANWKPRD